MLNQQAQSNKFHLSYQTASLITAASLLAIGFALYLWMEIAGHSMLYPLVATAAFAAFFALPALLLLWRAPWQTKVALIGAFLLLILVVRNFEWNTRKPFLRALDTLQVGMTLAQVDATMQGFMRGPAEGISEHGNVVYRHTDEGWGNADIGLITFENAQVVKIEYMPD